MSGYTWPDILTGLVRREGLEASAATWALNEIFAGRASEVQVAALLTALRAKGESEDEIAGLAGAMLANAAPIALDPDAIDIVGTGGDRANTVNVSTMAAIVAAGAGAKVIKHGARAASSRLAQGAPILAASKTACCASRSIAQASSNARSPGFSL